MAECRQGHVCLPARVVKLLAALILLAIAVPAPAQHYGFELFGRDAGLTNLEIYALYQDQAGFLWVGTRNGLFRYDGSRFLRFDEESGLPANDIAAIHQSADGTLWVATAIGLARWNRSRFEPVSLGRKYQMFGGGSVRSDQDGTLYFTTDRGLATGRMEGNQRVFSEIQTRSPAGNQPATGVYPGPDGRVWYGCGREICVYDGRDVVNLGVAQGVPAALWAGIGETASGDIWARSSEHLLVFSRGSTQGKPRSEPLASTEFRVGQPKLDDAGRMLVPTTDGLAIGGPGNWQYIHASHGLPADTVNAVLQDREGSVWIGLPGYGVVRWPGYQVWEIWGRPEGLANECIWNVRYDARGTLWAATGRGLFRFVKRKWERWPESGIPSSQAITFAFGKHDTIWAGSYPHGLYHVDVRTGAVRRWQGPGLPNTWIAGLMSDREGRLWVSTYVGLFRSSGEGAAMRFEKQSPPGPEGTETFYQCLQDRSGRIWAPGSNGLAMLDHGRWRRFTRRDGFEAPIHSMAEGPDGSIWVAYSKAVGISRLAFDGGRAKVTHFTEGQHLRSNLAYSVGFDRLGQLWVGTDNGVDVMRAGGWAHYDQSDGLAWNDTNLNSFQAGPGQEIWIGGSRGLSHYLGPGSGREYAIPTAVLTSVRFGNRPPEQGSHAEVGYGDRALHLVFTALTFQDSRVTDFRYRLSGWDGKWVSTRNRELHLPNLPPGHYRFELLARSARGVWSERPARFEFRILAPWYRRWWALLGFALSTIWLVRAAYRWRVRRLLASQLRLERVVAERTGELNEARLRAEDSSRLKTEFLATMSHEIRTPMNGVVGMANVLLSTKLDTEQREGVEIVRTCGESLLVLLSDILDVSKIEAGRMLLDSAAFSVRACVENAMRTVTVQAAQKGLGFTSNVDPDVPDALTGDDSRLRQVLVNLLGNAVKFTEKGQVSLRVAAAALDPEQVEIRFEVADTGIGIPPEKLSLIFEPFRQADNSTTRKYGGTGLGLTISARLVELMGGRMQVTSTPGEGSRFVFTIRAARSAVPVNDSGVAPKTTSAHLRPSHPSRRRQPHQSAHRRPIARKAGTLGYGGAKRGRGRRDGAAPALRHGPDGRADARDGRPGGHCCDPAVGGRLRRAHPDHRHDRKRHERRSRTMPGRRHGRIPQQTRPAARTVRQSDSIHDPADSRLSDLPRSRLRSRASPLPSRGHDRAR